jgi:hypothetical protein
LFTRQQIKRINKVLENSQAAAVKISKYASSSSEDQQVFKQQQ